MPPLRQQFTQTEQPHPWIARISYLEQWRSREKWLLIFSPAILFFVAAFPLAQVFIDKGWSYSSFLALLPSLPILLMFLLSSFIYFVFIHYAKRIERRRFVAVSGNPSLLADQQFQPDPDALQLPVQLSTNLEVAPRLFIGTFPLLLVLFATYLYFQNLPGLFGPLWSLVLSLIVIGVMLWALAYAILKRHTIEVTTAGIRAKTPWGTPTINWHEALLFACYPELGPWKESPLMVYELSSSSHMIYWTWTRHDSLLGRLRRPFPSYKRQNAQMQAFGELITAMTGLPLYDLSKEPATSPKYFGDDVPAGE